MSDNKQPHLKIHRPTDGASWWNQPEHSNNAQHLRRVADARNNGYSDERIERASVKTLRRMGASAYDHPMKEGTI